MAIARAHEDYTDIIRLGGSITQDHEDLNSQLQTISSTWSRVHRIPFLPIDHRSHMHSLHTRSLYCGLVNQKSIT